MNKSAMVAMGLGLAVLVGLGGWWYWTSQAPKPVPVERPVVAPAPPAPAPQAEATPAIQHPLDLPAAGEATPPASAADVESVLTTLFGRKSVLALFQTDDFARRVVATVDNLGRSHASARLWPVNPAGGRFVTEKQGEGDVIAAGNGERYTPYVQLAESVDLPQLVAVYLKFYPQLQRAYEELGYPGRYFNDRVVEVLDQLIRTPELAAPAKVRLPPIGGPTQPQRPWLLYEFEDPALQSLSAGQKILLRMGPANAQRVKARLVALRPLVATGAPKQ